MNNEFITQKKYKTIIIVSLIISIIGLSFAFAAISSNYQIIKIRQALNDNYKNIDKDGDGIIDDNVQNPVRAGDFKIIFENSDQGTAYERADKGTITINDNSYIVNNIILHGPGDMAVYTFDVVNKGTSNAKLDKIIPLKANYNGNGNNRLNDINIVKENLEYRLTYLQDNKPININDELKVGERKRLKLVIDYKEDTTDLPEREVVITNLGTKLIYVES